MRPSAVMVHATITAAIAVMGCSQPTGPQLTGPSGAPQALDRSPGVLASVSALAPGEAEAVLTLPQGNRPEGIAVDRTGRVFVGNRIVGGGSVVNQILVLSDDGTPVVFASLPTSVAGSGGLLGLATDGAGNVYAALASSDAATQGVYRVGASGSPIERLPGSEAISFANGLTFDGDGNLYASDSFAGKVWRFRDGAFSVWASGTLLEPLPIDPFGSPLPGVNGIDFHPPNHIYAANTERGLIARIDIEEDGSAGTPTAVTTPFSLPTVDGIALDVHGDIDAVVPGFTLVGTSPVVHVDAASGAISPIVTLAGEAAKFDSPLSIAFNGKKSAYVTNGHLPAAPGSAGPGVVRVGIGVAGSPL